MSSVLEKVNLYLKTTETEVHHPFDKDDVLLTIVETLDNMGIILNKEQQKTLLLNINSKIGDI